MMIEADEDHERAIKYVLACVCFHNLALEFDAAWRRDELRISGQDDRDAAISVLPAEHPGTAAGGKTKRAILKEAIDNYSHTRARLANVVRASLNSGD